MKKCNWNNLLSKPSFEIKFYNSEEKITSTFVKELRAKLNLSQRMFAKILGISEKTIEKWEQGTNPIKGTSNRLLYLLNKYEYLVDEFYSIDKRSEILEQSEMKYTITRIKKERINNSVKFVETTESGFRCLYNQEKDNFTNPLKVNHL